MKLGVENKKQLAILAVVGTLGVGSLVYIVNQVMGSDAPARTSAPVVVTQPAATAVKATKASGGGTAHTSEKSSTGSVTAALDPTLKMGPMLVTEALVYTGSGRNIFSAASAPIEIPKPVVSVRPKPLPPPPPLAPTGPPPPPPIDLKFFGTATSADGKRQAFLLKGDDVFLASNGDVVQRRYKVITVSANSIVVEDMTNNNRQTLPLLR